MKKYISMMIAGFPLTFGLAGTASACDGGNLCNSDKSVIGGGFIDGGYNVGGGAGNEGSGQVVNRGSFSDSAGMVSGQTNFSVTTCPASGCSNKVEVSGEGYGYQHSGSYPQTNGGYAASGASGGTQLLLKAGAFYDK